MNGLPGDLTSRAKGKTELSRDLGLLDTAAIHVGNILGSGIFVAPAAVAAAGLSGWQAAGLWIVGGIIATCGAACYAECGSRLPRAGGFYVFYRAAYGERLAFVGGWAALLITYPASIAAIALIFGQYLEEVLPGVGGGATPCAVGALLLAGVLNAVRVRTAAGIQKALTATKVTALAAVCLAAVWAFRAASSPGGKSAAPPDHPASAVALLIALVALLWTYDGWSDISLLAGEVRDPGKVLGRAVLLGTGVLVGLYATVQFAVGALLPSEQAGTSARVLAEAVQAGLGAGSGKAVALLVVVSTFGSIHGIVLTASRLGFAMARDGVFLSWFGQVSPLFGTPTRAVSALLGASLAYVFVAGFRNLLAFFSFSVWIFYGLTAVALLRLRKGRWGEEKAWRAPGGVAAPALVLLTAAGMTVGLMIENPRRSLIGLVLLLVGFPVHAFWRNLRR